MDFGKLPISTPTPTSTPAPRVKSDELKELRSLVDRFQISLPTPARRFSREIWRPWLRATGPSFRVESGVSASTPTRPPSFTQTSSRRFRKARRVRRSFSPYLPLDFLFFPRERIHRNTEGFYSCFTSSVLCAKCRADAPCISSERTAFFVQNSICFYHVLSPSISFHTLRDVVKLRSASRA